MPRPVSTTAGWDVIDLLNVSGTNPKFHFNCVGTNQKPNKEGHWRCGNQIAQHNAVVGLDMLRKLPLDRIGPEELQTKLVFVAEKLLCTRFHKKTQIYEVAGKWKSTIIAEQDRQARIQLPRRSRRIVQDSDGDISMSPEARAREQRLEEQRAAQLQSECPICYQPLDRPCETKCVHIFCHSCVDRWIQEHGNCPTCRAQATVHELVMIDSQYQQSVAAARALSTRAQAPRGRSQLERDSIQHAAPTVPSREIRDSTTHRSEPPGSQEPVAMIEHANNAHGASITRDSDTRTNQQARIRLRCGLFDATTAIRLPGSAEELGIPPASYAQPASQPLPQIRPPTSDSREEREAVRRTWIKRVERLSRNCAICVDTVQDPCETACKHVFCHSCLLSWLPVGGTCPECRASVRQTELTLI